MRDFKRTLRLAWLGLALCLAPNLCGAESVERFAKVKNWRLTVEWKYQLEMPESANPEIDVFVKGRAVYKIVALRESNKDQFLWSTERKFVPQGEFKAAFKRIHRKKGEVIIREEGGAEGWQEGDARFDIYPETGEFRMHAIASSKENKATCMVKGLPLQTTPFFVPLTGTPPCMEWIGQVPESGLTISAERHDVPCPILVAGNQPMIVNFRLEPWDMEEPPEVVVEVDDYEQWIPTADNEVGFWARLEEKDGDKKVKQTAKQFIFELLETSKLPGVCCNFPASEDKDPNFDMDFVPGSGNNPLICSKDGQEAKTPEGKYTRARAVIASWDNGGYSRLKVTAIMQDDQRVVGYLQGNKSETEIRFPKRAQDSKIADAWKEKNGAAGLSDDSDEDQKPSEGDGCTGDGLTLFEEYRGFMMEGSHASTDPRHKDFFVVNKLNDRVRQGVDLVAGVTKLIPHYVKAEEEADAEGVVNNNHGNGPHLADKWAVIIEPFFKPRDQRWESFSLGEGAPGTPKHVKITPKEDPSWDAIDITWKGRVKTDRYASILAHEILHTFGAKHHGDIDLGEKLWDKVNDPAIGLLEIREYGVNSLGNTLNSRAIHVYNESGKLLSAHSRELPVLPAKLWIGCEGGEHSGMEDCIMRYNNASAYIKPGEPDNRYLVDSELTGIYLCGDKQGTGVNAANRKPWPRYGNATSGGDCKHQICVNDAKH